MNLRFLFYRLFRRRPWAAALGMNAMQPRRMLRKETERVIHDHLEEIVAKTQLLRIGCSPEEHCQRLAELDFLAVRLEPLRLYATPRQCSLMEDCIRTVRYAHTLPKPQPRKGPPTEIRYYAVFIPTMNGRFYYLALRPYDVGDIVAIPFGQGDPIIYGIIEEVYCRDYWKMPLPMWKMKYIADKAPEQIAEQFRHAGVLCE